MKYYKLNIINLSQNFPSRRISNLVDTRISTSVLSKSLYIRAWKILLCFGPQTTSTTQDNAES